VKGSCRGNIATELLFTHSSIEPKRRHSHLTSFLHRQVHKANYRDGIFKLLRSPGIDSASLCSPGGPVQQPCSYTRVPTPLAASKIGPLLFECAYSPNTEKVRDGGQRQTFEHQSAYNNTSIFGLLLFLIFSKSICSFFGRIVKLEKRGRGGDASYR
jgi:hypothetical protein